MSGGNTSRKRKNNYQRGSKRCTRCLDWKRLTEFSPRNDVKGGYLSRCKGCQKERMKEYRGPAVGLGQTNRINRAADIANNRAFEASPKLLAWLYGDLSRLTGDAQGRKIIGYAT